MRGVFLAVLIILIGALIFPLVDILNKSPSSAGESERETVNPSINNYAGKDFDSEDNLNSSKVTGDKTGADNSGGSSSGSSSEGGSSSSATPEIPEVPEIESLELSCVLVRPKNAPDIECSVNYIQSDKVSLKFRNRFGEDLEIEANLNKCSPQLRQEVKNNEEKDFVFGCINSGYFSQELFVSYMIGGDQKVTIGGFVRGPVS